MEAPKTNLVDLKPLLALYAEFDKQLGELVKSDSGIETLLAEYVALNDNCAALTKLRDAANARIRSFMGDAKSLQSGQYLAVLMPGKRSDLDKVALASEIGQSLIDKHTVTKTYESLKVRKV